MYICMICISPWYIVYVYLYLYVLVWHYSKVGGGGGVCNCIHCIIYCSLTHVPLIQCPVQFAAFGAGNGKLEVTSVVLCLCLVV